jgi:SAM-dependent methyltransferase
MSVQFYEQNRSAWDTRVRQKKGYIDSAKEEDFLNPLALADPQGWLGGDVAGKRLLCLAAGGGRHSVLFAAAGAQVTVVDLSPQMLELDRKVAANRGLQITIIQASMDKLSIFPGASFQVVVQPVSSCYVPDVGAVYHEVARVVAAGGIYISHHKQPASLQAQESPAANSRGYLLTEPYYRKGPLPPASPHSLHREAGTIEFLHRWEELLGGLCRSGFVIEDVAEPKHAHPKAQPGSFGHRSQFLPPFISIKARRTRERISNEPDPTLYVT